MKHRPSRICLAALLLLVTSCARRSGPPPLGPEEELSSFRFSEDFHGAVFATEPQVIDPVEMVFDENGKIYRQDLADVIAYLRGGL